MTEKLQGRIQEMTSAKLMSVSRGNCNLSSIEKHAVMITNCRDLVFTLRVSVKARFLKQKMLRTF